MEGRWRRFKILKEGNFRSADHVFKKVGESIYMIKIIHVKES